MTNLAIMDSTRKFQLIVFKFNYTNDLVCLWPINIDISFENKQGKEEKEYFATAVEQLESYPAISKVKVIHNKLASFEECQDTFRAILGNEAGLQTIRVKYLTFEKQTVLKDEPVDDYKTNKGYAIIQTEKQTFPVRVRAEQYPFLLDDLELPLMVISPSEE